MIVRPKIIYYCEERMATDTFRVDTPTLQTLLEKIGAGQLQLPDFQRGWVWDDAHIQAIIASIAQGHPVGSIMGMETGGEARFSPVPFKGAPKIFAVPEMLILDGQQRLTSLFLSLKSQDSVPTRNEQGKDLLRWYYLDMEHFLAANGDPDDAILSLPDDKKRTKDIGRRVELDLSLPEYEYESGKFPLNLVYDMPGMLAWQQGYQAYFNTTEKSSFVSAFVLKIVQIFGSYKVPMIVLSKLTPKVAVCTVFENVNTGGVPLTVFELLTATYAADGFKLRDDWEERKGKLHKISKNLHGIDETDFLAAVTLYASYKKSITGKSAVSCKRKDILNLALETYKQHADELLGGFRKASKFLHTQKIFDAFNLPYKTQIIPLSAICAALGEAYDLATAQEKLAQWYWCGALGELYGSANETRYANDMQQVPKWIQGDEMPVTIRDGNFAPTRLLSLQTRNSAAYKGIAALLMNHGCQDFISGQSLDITNYFDEAVDIHHIFPAAHCESQKYDRNLWNSVVNKTPLSARTNRALGGRAPSAYLGTLEKNSKYAIPQQVLDNHLKTHLIDIVFLRNDDFGGFIISRTKALLNLIQAATGKAVVGLDSEETIRAFGNSLI
jgi:hypothetical protein